MPAESINLAGDDGDITIAAGATSVSDLIFYADDTQTTRFNLTGYTVSAQMVAQDQTTFLFDATITDATEGEATICLTATQTAAIARTIWPLRSSSPVAVVGSWHLDLVTGATVTRQVSGTVRCNMSGFAP